MGCIGQLLLCQSIKQCKSDLRYFLSTGLKIIFFKYYVFLIGLAPRRQFEVRGEEKMELYPANPTVRLHLTQRIFFLKSLDLTSATPVRLFTTLNSKMMKNLIFYSSFFITNRIWPLSKN